MHTDVFKPHLTKRIIHTVQTSNACQQPLSRYQYSNTDLRLSRQNYIFHLPFNPQKRLGYKENTAKHTSLPWKLQSHVRILIYRTLETALNIHKNGFLTSKSHMRLWKIWNILRLPLFNLVRKIYCPSSQLAFRSLTLHRMIVVSLWTFWTKHAVRQIN